MQITPSYLQKLIDKHFSQLHEIELKNEILNVCTFKELPANHLIIDVGNYVKSIPLLISGSIKVVREDEIEGELLLYYLNAGATCAMSLTCCMQDKKSTIRAITEEESTLLFIPVKYMDIWIQKYVSWKNFIMITYQQRFEELINTIDSIAFLKLDERLIHYLKKKSQSLQNKKFDITHLQIAHDLNSSREVVSRLLKQLEKRNQVILSRNSIELLF